MTHKATVEFTNQDFDCLQNYAINKLGILVRQSKIKKIVDTLHKRIELLKLGSIPEYISYIDYNQSENIYFINLITNNTTCFFRENHHFEFLKSFLQKNTKKSNTFKIWSAGCASGEEPYSIAFTILETIPDLANFDIKILATDINTRALEKAKLGMYDHAQIEKLESHRKWFDVIPNTNPIKYKIKSQVQSMVNFKQLNLLDSWPITQYFDIIFFRNVSIYMTETAIHTIIEKFYRKLSKNGILIVGSAETLGHYSNLFFPLGKTIYQKIEKN